jgi:uncharacterized protein (TIGR02145 family)
MSKVWKLFAFAVMSLALLCSCSDDNATGSESAQSSVPTVSTNAVSEIDQISAESGGTVTSDGGASVTARGVCWSTSATPTTADNSTTDGTGTGSFTSSITGLTVDTDYYVRAYATNSAGTGYGNQQSFTTLSTVGTVTDIDGNVYPTIMIGNQVWMAENLKVTHYRNGDSIPNITNGAAWDSYGAGALGDIHNSLDSVAIYGRMYNWYAVNDSRNIAPDGWHVPTYQEWVILQNTLGTDAGNDMKEVGTAHWTSPNDLATNSSGFTALGAGIRGEQGYYIALYQQAYYWSSTEYDDGDAREARLSHSSINLSLGGKSYKRTGCSIRCVKD